MRRLVCLLMGHHVTVEGWDSVRRLRVVCSRCRAVLWPKAGV